MTLLSFIYPFLLSLIITSVGFYKYTYLYSIDYAYSLTAMCIFLFMVYGNNLNNATFILCSLLILYSLRVVIYFHAREYNKNYSKEKNSNINDGKSISFINKILLAIVHAFIYTCEISPVLFRIVNAKGILAIAYAGIGISFFGAMIEVLGDYQKLVKKKSTRFVDTGKSKMVHYPNYFGEILFWTGIFVSGITVYNNSLQWIFAIFGYCCIIMITYGATVPLEKTHLKKYQEYIKITPIFIPAILFNSLKKDDNGYKFETFEIIQKVGFDKNLSDINIKCIIDLEGKIDIDHFREAVQIVIDRNPIISSRLCEKFFTAKWVYQKFPIDDFVFVYKCSDRTGEKIINEYLYKTFNVKEGPLVRFVVIQYPDHDQLLFTVTHCACDGTGFKELIYTLCSIYSSRDIAVKYPPIEDRSLDQFFDAFTFKEKLGILASNQEQCNNYNFKLEGDDTRPFMVKKVITKDEFNQINAYSKEKSATINDILLTGILRATYSIINQSIALPCAINLRNFIGGRSKGLANLVFHLNCYVGEDIGDTFEITLKKVSEVMNKEKNSPNFSKILYLVDLAYKLLPYQIVKKIIIMNFNLSFINYSNIGIIDKSKLVFKDVKVSHAHMIGSTIHAPYNEISVSTFDNNITLSYSSYGSPNDEKVLNGILEKVVNEILTNC